MHYLEVSKKLSVYKVGIAGCGGLGSNCAMALARAGIGELIIADFDTVEESNLNRQYYFMDQIGMEKIHALADNIRLSGSTTKVHAISIRLDESNVMKVFGECDVVVEAFDHADQKVMLIESLLGNEKTIPVVSGIGIAGWGNMEMIKICHYDKLIVCGDMMSEASDELSPLAPKVGIVANMQANIVLELLLGKPVINALKNEDYTE